MKKWWLIDIEILKQGRMSSSCERSVFQGCNAYHLLVLEFLLQLKILRVRGDSECENSCVTPSLKLG